MGYYMRNGLREKVISRIICKRGIVLENNTIPFVILENYSITLT